jgi:hypothetical protein
MAPFPGSNHDPIANLVQNIHSTIGRHDPVRELTNGFNFRDEADGIFGDVLESTYGRAGNQRDSWRRTPEIQDDFGIDYSHDRYIHNMRPEFDRTSRELMRTLDKHSGGINIGRHSDSITRSELKNYLVRVGDNIAPQDKADLLLVMRDFDQISRSSGKDGGRGISYSDMAWYVVDNRRSDRAVLFDRQMDLMRNYYDTTRQGLDQWNQAEDFTETGARGGTQEVGKIVTERNGPNNHYRVEGAELALSPEVFKRHYGITEDLDFLKFMPGKANDGKVPSFWESEVAAGLGGRDANGGLRWDNPNHHEELPLDFQRNFAQLAKYFDRVPIDKQEEFVLNFARTQEPLIRAHGGTLLAVDNEKIQIHMNGRTYYVDLVQDVGSSRKLLQWGEEA